MSKETFKIEYGLKHIKGFDKLSKSKQKEYEFKSGKEAYSYNLALLKHIGKKKYDYLQCWEPGLLDTKETIYDYDTLYDLSEKDKAFQLKSIKEHQKEGEEYYNPQFDENYCYLWGEWFRYINADENNKLIYASIYGLNSYLYYEIQDIIDKYINKKIPNMLHNEYKESMFTTKINEKGKKYRTVNFNYETRAFGKEKEYKEIHDYISRNDYFIYLTNLIEKHIKDFGICTFIKQDFKDWDYCEDHILANNETAKLIHTKTYMKDLVHYQQPFGVVENVMEKIIKEAKKDLNKKFPILKI